MTDDPDGQADYPCGPLASPVVCTSRPVGRVIKRADDAPADKGAECGAAALRCLYEVRRKI